MSDAARTLNSSSKPMPKLRLVEPVPEPWLATWLDDGGSAQEPTPPRGRLGAGRTIVTPASIIAGWSTAPPQHRVSTGIKPLDDLCGGGMPFPRRVFVVGAPGGWKTGLAVYVANTFDCSGEICVGFLAIDEEADPAVTMRLAQMAALSRGKLEQRDPAELASAAAEFGNSRIRFYDHEHTIESAAADLAKFAAAEGKRPALFVDSIQTVFCEALRTRSLLSPRDIVETNVAAIKHVQTEYDMFVLATSEANRNAYRDPSSTDNKMAAAAESRAIEYAAQTLIFTVADKDDPTVFRTIVAKNRACVVGEFAFQLERVGHEITILDVKALAASKRAKGEADKRGDAAKRELDDAVSVARELIAVPGLSVNQLHNALRARHGSFAEGRVNRAAFTLGAGLLVRIGPNRSKRHYIDGRYLPEGVLRALPNGADSRPPEENG